MKINCPKNLTNVLTAEAAVGCLLVVLAGLPIEKKDSRSVASFVSKTPKGSSITVVVGWDDETGGFGRLIFGGFL